MCKKFLKAFLNGFCVSRSERKKKFHLHKLYLQNNLKSSFCFIIFFKVGEVDLLNN